jgi:hypothetical protein
MKILTGNIPTMEVRKHSSNKVQVPLPYAHKAPKVVVSLVTAETVGTGACSASVWNVSDTQFLCNLVNDSDYTRHIGASWIAVYEDE